VLTQGGKKMENTFDSTYIINKAKYAEFVAEAGKLAVAAYTIPAFVWPDLYKMIDINRDIAMRVVWKPETTVKQIKEFDKVWFLKKYS
jgi:hypothetical protein